MRRHQLGWGPAGLLLSWFSDIHKPLGLRVRAGLGFTSNQGWQKGLEWGRGHGHCLPLQDMTRPSLGPQGNQPSLTIRSYSFCPEDPQHCSLRFWQSSQPKVMVESLAVYPSTPCDSTSIREFPMQTLSSLLPLTRELSCFDPIYSACQVPLSGRGQHLSMVLD